MAATGLDRASDPTGGRPNRDQTDLERKATELQALFEISRIISSAPDLRSLLDSTVERLVGVLSAAESAAVLLHRAHSDALEVASVYGCQADPLRETRILGCRSLWAEVLRSGRAQVFATPEEIARAWADLGEAAPGPRDLPLAVDSLPHSAVCVPLISRSEKAGVLLLEHIRNGGRFTASDLAFVQALADLVALAIEKHRLQIEAEQTRVLQEANRLKSELLSTLSHEMRTPLASIKGYTTALLMEDTPWNEETRREFLQIIDEETDNLRELITDLLESSTIEAGLLRIEPQPALLARLAQRAVEQASLRTRTHRFVVSFPPDFPVVDADPRRIEQVLHNLLDNAVKYSPDGGIIVVRGRVQQGEAVVSVADEGVGIAPEHLNRLFERFFRVKSGIGPNVVGTGLGLPIARTIVESHGGRIWAESTLGAGTTFSFTLPVPEWEEEHE